MMGWPMLKRLETLRTSKGGMVNKALMQKNHRGVMERKRKLVRQHQSGSSSGPRVATSSAGLVLRPAQP
jgi:hypothetical protein